MQTEYYAKRRERDGHGEKLRALKAEQRRVEEEARLERSKKKDTLAEAMKDTRTLEGFDHETDLQLGLLQQKMKVRIREDLTPRN